MGQKASYPESFLDTVWKAPMPQREATEQMQLYMETKLGWFLVSFKPSDQLNVIPCGDPTSDGKTPVHRVWKSVTTMRDFEVIEPTKEHYVISKGQGIGVIVVESHHAYLKIAYDKKERKGIKIIFTTWHHGEDAKAILDNDVSIGYDVQYCAGAMNNSKWWCLHEKREAKGGEGQTLIPSCGKYQDYDVATGKPCGKVKDRSGSPDRKSKSRSRSRSPPKESESAAAASPSTK